MTETNTLPDYPTDISFQQIRAAQKETDRIIQQTALQMQETDRRMQETDRQVKETSREMRILQRQMGKLHNSFGDLAQHLVAPNIIEKFNELGFFFTKTSLNVKITEPENKDTLAEVDILLEDGDIVVAVEVKARATDEDVDDHVIRMEKLRLYADARGDKRRYQGAMAVAILDNSLRRYIQKKGFYLIEQTGDTVRINIPEGFSPKEW